MTSVLSVRSYKAGLNGPACRLHKAMRPASTLRLPERSEPRGFVGRLSVG